MESAKAKILFDNEAINALNEVLASRSPSKIFFLVDENTHEKCLIPLLQNLPDLNEMEILEVEAGESSKSVEVLSQLWEALSDLEADRSSLLVNVGGGMITDLGGFLASSYMRGIDFINFPTSLLAQVDASVGGKTGINLNHHKNRIGLFQEPIFTGICNDFLDSLSQVERLSGFAEMLKHGLISDKSYWEELCNFPILDEYPNTRLIQKSVEIKAGFVNQDFRESGSRKILNFGHSIGHAYESLALENNISLPHGFAIAYGMMAESILSTKYLGLTEDDMNDIVLQIQGKYPEMEFEYKVDDLMAFIKVDKKNKEGKLNFSLLKSIGKAEFNVEVEEKDVINVLEFMISNA